MPMQDVYATDQKVEDNSYSVGIDCNVEQHDDLIILALVTE